MCQSAGTVDSVHCLCYCCFFHSWYFQRCIKHLPHSPGRLHQSKPDLLHTCQFSYDFVVKYSSVTSYIFSAGSLALPLWCCSLSLYRFLLSQKVHHLLVYLNFCSSHLCISSRSLPVSQAFLELAMLHRPPAWRSCSHLLGLTQYISPTFLSVVRDDYLLFSSTSRNPSMHLMIWNM